MARFNLDYEVKCRICDTVSRNRMQKQDDKTDFENWKYLMTWFNAHLNKPSINLCDTCEKDTVQDYVSVVGRPQE